MASVLSSGFIVQVSIITKDKFSGQYVAYEVEAQGSDIGDLCSQNTHSQLNKTVTSVNTVGSDDPGSTARLASAQSARILLSKSKSDHKSASKRLSKGQTTSILLNSVSKRNLTKDVKLIKIIKMMAKNFRYATNFSISDKILLLWNC